MYYEIVKLHRYSGKGCTIYTVRLKGQTQTLFEKFIADNLPKYQGDIRKLIANLRDIGAELGMREKFFKPEEARLGDQICAMYIKSGPGIRLYFVKYGQDVIILGGGGDKGPGVKAWQDDPELAVHVELLKRLSEHIGSRLEKREDLWWSKDLTQIEGELKNYEDEEASERP